MKLEKREIMLNEQDSLSDVAFMEKALLYEYVEGVAMASRKETREKLLAFMKSAAEDLFLINDLLEKVKEDTIK